MTTKAKVEARALQLGYKLEDTGYEIRLEAPKGFSFDNDYHELVSDYDLPGEKALAWKDVYLHIGKAEPCQIEECDWCLSI